MSAAGNLHRELEEAGVPIEGVVIGIGEPKKNWAIHFKPNATDAHRKKAAKIVQSFDADKAEQVVARVLRFKHIAMLVAAQEAAKDAGDKAAAAAIGEEIKAFK